MTMNDHIFAQPLWLVVWVMMLIGIHVVAIPFAIKDWRPRIMIIVMGLNMGFMSALFSKYGYTRILGLSHVIFWTPLLAYLWKSRNNHPDRVWTGRLVKAAMVLIFISLLVDYADVIRYVLGDHTIVGGLDAN